MSNFEGEKTGLYCLSNKLKGMSLVKHTICEIDGCKTTASFNYEGQKAKFCKKHKLENMVCVKNRLCIYPECKTRSSFNFKGENKGLYCAKHKKIGMLDVTHTKCKHDQCEKYPIFNFENEPTGKFCIQHKLEGMQDVKNKKCLYHGCAVRPHYNYKGETKFLYCAQHKKNGMIDIKSKRCKVVLCETIVSRQKYDGYCMFCYINLFPDKPVARNYKTKEYTVVEYIKNNFPELTWIYDKKVSDGCSKRRPDLFLDLGYQIIIVEVDENKHTDYDCSCENKRIMELSQDVNHRPIIFIRFNPDDYIDGVNNVSSCWGINQKGICVIKKSKKKEWDKRLESLGEQIKYWINEENKTEKTVEIIQLFYDK
jgi:hypothetical protein